MSKTILFWPDVYKEQGHWLPTLHWAQQLHDDGGHVIKYMGIEDCRNIIDAYPIDSDNHHFDYTAIFGNIYPLGYTTECHTSPNERWHADHIWAIAYSALSNLETDYKGKLNDKLYADALAFQKAMSTPPDLLVSGYFTSLESLLIHKIYNVPVVISTTYLRHPSEDPAMRAIQNLKAFSRTELFKLMNLATIRQESYEDPEIELQDFIGDLETFKELIPCPREFEYSHYTPGDMVHYVDPCITNEFIPPASDTIDWDSVLANEKLVFVTAGSQVLDYEGKARHLFHSMCEAMSSAELSDHHLILGVGTKLMNDYEWYEFKDAPNITIAGWVPQRRILSSSNLEIALVHGGLATIKECIYNNKKFLILPMGKDQVDNSLRLRKYGIDNSYPISSVSSANLVSAITAFESDRESIERLAVLSGVFVAAEGNKPGYHELMKSLGEE